MPQMILDIFSVSYQSDVWRHNHFSFHNF